MEFTRGECKNKRGNAYITPDGQRYTLSKDRESVSYSNAFYFARYVQSRAKLNKLTNLITVSCKYNHTIEDYRVEKSKVVKWLQRIPLLV